MLARLHVGITVCIKTNLAARCKKTVPPAPAALLLQCLTACVAPNPACSLADEASARQLLQLGADPNAGGPGGWASPLRLLLGRGLRLPACASAVVEPLLQHGADCLQLGPPGIADCTLVCLLSVSGSQAAALADSMVAHLERQRVAGTLQLGSKARAAQLAQAAAWRGHAALLAHSLSWLEDYHATAAGVLAWQDRNTLWDIRQGAIKGTAPLATLPVLLASSLPFDLNARGPHGLSAAGHAAISGNNAPAAVRLLVDGGARVTLLDLLHVVRFLAAADSGAAALEALLSCGRPGPDPTQPTTYLPAFGETYTCPIHCALQTAVRVLPTWLLGQCGGASGPAFGRHLTRHI